MQTAFHSSSRASIVAKQDPFATTTNLAVALAFAEAGVPIYPTSPSSKAPLVLGGYKAATTNCETITGWWTCWPNALAAIATGPASRLWVLDVDVRSA